MELRTLGALTTLAAVVPATTAAVSPLPGQLDTVEIANSNHPEGVRGPGIALSTLPLAGPAHLNHALQGELRIFAHHKNTSGHALYQTIAIYNPNPGPVAYALQAGAVTTTSEAPFHDPPGNTVTPLASATLSGPGEATAARVMLQESQPAVPATAAPGLTLLAVKPVQNGEEVSSLFELHAEQPLYPAVVFTETAPQAGDVMQVLQSGTKVAGEPDAHPPSPPGSPPDQHFVYGRVAGVQQGATWHGRLTHGNPDAFALGRDAVSESYALDTKVTNTLGTGQQQAAPLVARYPEAAYQAHGNYGVTYDLDLPLRNDSGRKRTVDVSLLSPPDAHSGLRSFRGVVAVEERGQTHMLAVDETEGTAAPPLWEGTLPPGEARDLQVHLVYAADNTPPHILRVSSP